MTREFQTTRRYFFKPEIEELLHAAGLNINSVSAGFCGEAADDSSERLVYTLQKG